MFQNIATFAGQPDAIREFRHAMEVSRVDTHAMVSEYEKLVISEAYEQIGLKKGREEGRAELAEKIKDVAKKLKEMGLPIAQIVQASGLPEDVVEGL